MMLSSLHISGYRGLKELNIPHLAPTNLIVGKNSVGKSSLLEAILLYAYQGSPQSLLNDLERRNEGIVRPSSSIREKPDSILTAIQDIRYLFHNRPTLDSATSEKYSVNIREIQKQETELIIDLASMNYLNNQPSLFNGLGTDWGIRTTFGNQEFAPISLIDLFTPTGFRRSLALQIPTQRIVYIPTSGLDFNEHYRYWTEISLTKMENEIIKALNFVIPDITRINFVDSTISNQSKVAIVVYKNERVPLASLGSGLERILGLALALANAQGGILLVDEIGSGLHYTVQTKMWEFLMTLAHELNVQIFATTHSSDCVRAFEYVSNQLTDIEGQLIRLEKWEDEVTATLINEKQMQFALEEGIEVR